MGKFGGRAGGQGNDNVLLYGKGSAAWRMLGKLMGVG